MNKPRVKVLQVDSRGAAWDVSALADKPLQWDWVPVEAFGEWIEAQVEAGETPHYTLVLWTGDQGAESVDLEALVQLADPYCFLIDQGLEGQGEAWDRFLRASQAQQVDFASREPGDWLLDFYKYFFSNQYGERRHIQQFVFQPQVQAQLRYQGHHRVQLDQLAYGDWAFLASLQSNIIFEAMEPLDLWLEYQVRGDLDLRMKVLGHDRTGALVASQVYDLGGGDQVLVDFDVSCWLSVLLEAKGEGDLSLGPLHMRYSRGPYGQYLVGGQRLVDRQREELAYYFHPGNLKPPLNVYFSGYRSAEGFEGYYMMKALGQPFLLVTDPRLEGGDFYLGSKDLEQELVQVIASYMAGLGFAPGDLVLSGLSMGTFGALYYGTFFSPYAIVLGKPLVHLAQVAGNMRVKRPFGFDTSLDMVLKAAGSWEPDRVQALDGLVTDRIAQAQWEGTTLAIAYMNEDDYDTTAYYAILDSLGQRQTTVISRGYTGRHNDETQKINNWFFSQFTRLLSEYRRGDGHGSL